MDEPMTPVDTVPTSRFCPSFRACHEGVRVELALVSVFLIFPNVPCVCAYSRVMRKHNRTSVLVPSEPFQVLALKSRLRGRICDVVYSLGSATAHQIADWLDVPASTLYEHLSALEDAGLLRAGEPVRTTKNFARTYEAPASSLKITHSAEKQETRAAISEVVSSQLRLAGREFEESLVSDELPAGTDRDRLDSGSTVGWLSDADVEEVNRLLDRVMRIYTGSGPSEERQLHAITWVTRPASTGRRSN